MDKTIYFDCRDDDFEMSLTDNMTHQTKRGSYVCCKRMYPKTSIKIGSTHKAVLFLPDFENESTLKVWTTSSEFKGEAEITLDNLKNKNVIYTNNHLRWLSETQCDSELDYFEREELRSIPLLEAFRNIRLSLCRSSLVSPNPETTAKAYMMCSKAFEDTMTEISKEDITKWREESVQLSLKLPSLSDEKVSELYDWYVEQL